VVFAAWIEARREARDEGRRGVVGRDGRLPVRVRELDRDRDCGVDMMSLTVGSVSHWEMMIQQR
jgi:hypothetical protein